VLNAPRRQVIVASGPMVQAFDRYPEIRLDLSKSRLGRRAPTVGVCTHRARGFFWTGDQVVISLPRSRRRSRRCRLARMLHYTSACGAAAVIGRDQSGRRRRNQCQSSKTFQQIRLQLRWSSRTSSRTSAGVFLAATLVPGCGPPRSPRRTQRRRRPSRTPQHPDRGLPRAPRPPWIDIRLGPMPRACLTRQSR
jgi:hypothetical protein